MRRAVIANKAFSTLRRPQYDIKRLKELSNELQNSVERRELTLPNNHTVHSILSSYDSLVSLQRERAALVSKRNFIARTETLQLKEIKASVKKLESSIKQRESQVYELIDSIPNLISPNTNDESTTVEILNGEAIKDHRPELDHVTITKDLDLVDFVNASRVSGSSSYYLINEGALLEQALIQYALSKARARGWNVVAPPTMVRSEFIQACGFKPRDQNGERQVYSVEHEDLSLVGTSEISLAGLYSQRSIPQGSLPLRKVGISRCYRAEAGARGKDTKGLYRVHEFNKVELFAWVSNYEDSVKMLEEILDLQKDIVSNLGIPARVITIPPNDLGAPAYKKYDIEAWMPGRNGWGELTSASNCLDYQSRRLHTKLEGTSDYAYTLNGTALAVPRVLIAILENFYDPHLKRLDIPKVLTPFM